LKGYHVICVKSGAWKEIFGTTFAKVLSAVGLVCGTDKVGDAVLLKQLDVRVHRHILGLFSDEKPHVVVLYLGGNGADSRPSHFAQYWEGSTAN